MTSLPPFFTLADSLGYHVLTVVVHASLRAAHRIATASRLTNYRQAQPLMEAPQGFPEFPKLPYPLVDLGKPFPNLFPKGLPTLEGGTPASLEDRVDLRDSEA